MMQQLTTSVKKQICSDKKLGESALKVHTDGSFICPSDSIADNLKIMEEAITSNNLKDKVGIGLVFQADLFYIPDQKKYESDNPKAPYDTDQLVCFFPNIIF